MVIDPNHSFKVAKTLVSRAEPWVYCTSIPPTTHSEAKKLVAAFPKYDATTGIADAASFAMQLGTDLGISLDLSKHVEVEPTLKILQDVCRGEGYIDRAIPCVPRSYCLRGPIWNDGIAR